MSAFVVGKRHIDVIIKTALNGPSNVPQRKWNLFGPIGWTWDGERHELIEEMASNVGQVLVDENVRSVAYLYRDCDPDTGDLPGPTNAYYIGPYNFGRNAPQITLVELASAIHRLEYQSCECLDWARDSGICVLFGLASPADRTRSRLRRSKR